MQEPRPQRPDCGIAACGISDRQRHRPGQGPSRLPADGAVQISRKRPGVAKAQEEGRGLFIEDGWTYFIHGWTQVIAEVFHIDITGERLAACDRLAREMRK